MTGAEFLTQPEAWESLKRNASAALVADAVFVMETGPRELIALYEENPR